MWAFIAVPVQIGVWMALTSCAYRFLKHNGDRTGHIATLLFNVPIVLSLPISFGLAVGSFVFDVEPNFWIVYNGAFALVTFAFHTMIVGYILD